MNKWIKHNGGDCPVPIGTLVDVKLRGGVSYGNQQAWGYKRNGEDINTASFAGAAFWRNDGKLSDIVAYRLSVDYKAQRDELLAACHDALNNLPPDSECAAFVRAAIAKADQS